MRPIVKMMNPQRSQKGITWGEDGIMASTSSFIHGSSTSSACKRAPSTCVADVDRAARVDRGRAEFARHGPELPRSSREWWRHIGMPLRHSRCRMHRHLEKREVDNDWRQVREQQGYASSHGDDGGKLRDGFHTISIDRSDTPVQITDTVRQEQAWRPRRDWNPCLDDGNIMVVS
jgi:hypothetical protein